MVRRQPVPPRVPCRPDRPHPLFREFVAASIAVADGREPELRPRHIAAEPTSAEPTAIPVGAIDDVESAGADVIETVSGT